MGMRIKKRLSRTATAIFALFVAFSLIACGTDSSASSDAASSSGQQSEEVVQKGAVSFIVKNGDDVPDSLTLQVVLSGKTESGDTVDERYKASFDSKYALDIEPGDYELSIAPASLVQDETYYQCEKQAFSFGGKKDVDVILSVQLDEQATKAAEEKRKQEEAAKAEEERQRQEAAAQAEAERQRQEAAAQAEQERLQQQAAVNNSATVYITNTGKCYHNAGCSSLKKSQIATTVADAQARGLRPCSKCNPPS